MIANEGETKWNITGQSHIYYINVTGRTIAETCTVTLLPKQGYGVTDDEPLYVVKLDTEWLDRVSA